MMTTQDRVDFLRRSITERRKLADQNRKMARECAVRWPGGSVEQAKHESIAVECDTIANAYEQALKILFP